ncbi:peptide-methionine (S)-S-oxide reductase MsrA [Jannaschia aquimarina]|uniref:Peptide methionine sulfoxide reductase MsrA n=1 Tax=Jannaschia aquimarina TaxID=935700 RepID=A0A0D1DA14_9RHOB|nr:peptide-methionine (S)-S-oxide reductase MsrA [Jannaschia aquimarina]KIT16733.1 Peptide methionine sulfoxide reductase MsrA 2 [Jannaschia aquimarina]SNS53664.1 peptide-methionine (S)-S-oxide reductase [Jannaschia aquimarina]
MKALPFALLILATPAAAQETAIFAGGCFWCVEADFESVEGVGDAISGFTGGTTPDPVYRRSGDHIEAVRIPYDPTEVDYERLVSLFLRSIDPFDAGGQFCDRGLEYTTAIFALNEEQRAIAEAQIAEAEEELGREIVTPVVDTSEFYPVDDYHQDYYKSEERLPVSSVGIAVPKSVAYKRYRQGCGRDARVRQVWGDDAPFLPENGES